jgi:hypothetical protein
MSSLDGWSPLDGWDGWDGWQQRVPSTSTLWLALTHTRERLVAPMPEQGASAVPERPACGDAVFSLPEQTRVQLATMDLLSKFRVARGATAREVTVTDVDAKHLLTLSAPSDEAFTNDLPKVEAWATQRSERSAEILNQLSYNPAFWSVILPLSPQRTPRTLELMEVWVAVCSYLVQSCKVLFNLPRPSQWSPRIQPMIAVPGYSTFPGGHAAESHLLALGLTELLKAANGQATTARIETAAGLMKALASRIAANRVVAGIHFTLDSDAGQQLAEALLAPVMAAGLQNENAGDSVYAQLWQAARAEWMPRDCTRAV